MWHSVFSFAAASEFRKRGILRPSLVDFSFHILFGHAKRIWPSETNNISPPPFPLIDKIPSAHSYKYIGFLSVN